LKKAEQYRSQEETVTSLAQSKKDANRLQQEEEKLKLLETARDQIFEESHHVRMILFFHSLVFSTL
jgi:hypothetical protein